MNLGGEAARAVAVVAESCGGGGLWRQRAVAARAVAARAVAGRVVLFEALNLRVHTRPLGCRAASPGSERGRHALLTWGLGQAHLGEAPALHAGGLVERRSVGAGTSSVTGRSDQLASGSYRIA